MTVEADKWEPEDRLDNLIRLERQNEPSFHPVDEGSYRFIVPSISTTFEVAYLRREKDQLKAELLVRCELPGAQTYGGILSCGDINLSATRTRKSEALHLAERARTGKDVDWHGLVEELALRVLDAERKGDPAVLLRDVPLPPPEDILSVDGLPLLANHPLILFGDGGTAKSYLALWIAGRIATRKRVAYFDWELDAGDHRTRLENLFGKDMPEMFYARCARPLIHEAERLRKIVKECKIDYAIFDSVAFACDGPPESAETVGRYFQALRQLGSIGSLHIAHVTKNAETSHLKPFGSAFWHNGARSTWNIKQDEDMAGSAVSEVALHHRKANLGKRCRSIGFRIEFGDRWTKIVSCDPSDNSTHEKDMTVAQRIKKRLSKGNYWTVELLKKDMPDVKGETIERKVRKLRESGIIREVAGGVLLLIEGRVEE